MLSIVIGRHLLCSGYRGFETQSGKTKENKIDICNFSAKPAASTSKSKDWFARNYDSVSEWSTMYTHGLLVQWASTIKFQLSGVVYYKVKSGYHSHLIECNLFSSWYSYKMADVTLATITRSTAVALPIPYIFYESFYSYLFIYFVHIFVYIPCRFYDFCHIQECCVCINLTTKNHV